jgi:transcriptional regulator with XRE-family HTH domain
MAVRQGPVELGDDNARTTAVGLGKEIRDARIVLGMSQPAAAKAAGISSSQLSRLERGDNRDPSLRALCRVGRVLGLSLSARLYPAGSPVRDAGQQRVLDRFLALPAAPIRSEREVVLPITGDLRAWDASLTDGVTLAFVDAETRLGDVQALERRIQLKLRDDPRSRILILVVARSRHNTETLAGQREALRSLLPLDGPAIARSLRQGRIPPASGLILV